MTHQVVKIAPGYYAVSPAGQFEPAPHFYSTGYLMGPKPEAAKLARHLNAGGQTNAKG